MRSPVWGFFRKLAQRPYNLWRDCIGFHLDRSVSGSIIPRGHAFSVSAVFPEAVVETDEFALTLAALQTIPLTRASSDAIYYLRLQDPAIENCVFCA